MASEKKVSDNSSAVFLFFGGIQNTMFYCDCYLNDMCALMV
jgi:hypothetical protein